MYSFFIKLFGKCYNKCYNKCYTKKYIDKNKGVYVLKLENKKYYIGKSNDIKRRIWIHTNNNGSKWTSKNKLIKRIPNITNDTGVFSELIETLECMKMYGIDNVRGSMFTQINLSNDDKIKAAELYCEMYDLCRKCGSNKHFITNCNNNKIELWVNNFGGKLTGDRKCIKCSKNINDKLHYHKYCNECY
jgi:hypothetical protein